MWEVGKKIVRPFALYAQKKRNKRGINMFKKVSYQLLQISPTQVRVSSMVLPENDECSLKIARFILMQCQLIPKLISDEYSETLSYIISRLKL